jgi:ferredoxin
MILKDWMKSKGFNVIAGHSLATPGNFPPAIANGWINLEDPDEQTIKEFDKFILKLDNSLEQIKNDKNVPEFILTLSERDMSFPFAVRNKAKDDMGDIFVAKDLCTTCGKCKKVCPYGAIELTPFPVFDNSKCYGCWACFNNCSSKAIYTSNVRGSGHYKQPTEKLKEKLGL